MTGNIITTWFPLGIGCELVGSVEPVNWMYDGTTAGGGDRRPQTISVRA